MQRLSQSPTAPDFVQDPYRFYARARATGDLFWWEEYGMLAAASHRAVNLVLRDRRFGREIPPECAVTPESRLTPFYDIEAHSMLELEPPRHTRLRGLVVRAFTSGRVRALAPDIKALCENLISTFPEGPFDLLAAYATPLPVIIIARLLGIDPARAPELLAWSNAMVGMYQAGRSRRDEDAAITASIAFRAFLEAEIAKKSARPDDGLLSGLIATHSDDGHLSRDELVATAILLLNAGHEATVHSLGNMVRTLLLTGRTGSALTDAARQPGMVDEALRFDPPLHLFTRYAYEDMDVFGTPVARGDKVAALLASANRDETVWTDAATFDPARKALPHSSFGAGLHFCVGAPLARLELDIALRTLAQKCPTLKLAETPHYADIYHFHGLDRLMVTI
jgi:cytochrome P450